MDLDRIRNEIERGELSLTACQWLSGARLVYIASPYTQGDVGRNVHAAILAAETLVRLGFVPIVPLLSHFWHVASPHEWAYWMALDLQWIHHADAILRLPGESEGADLEVALAKLLGKPVFYSVQELQQFIPKGNDSKGDEHDAHFVYGRI
ncbi:MAG: DUF4406 domain-containing protein [Anaerolineae bacterium]|nr:DUF4406 domain-containing protein [Anaerolineae bacterium]